MVRHSPTRLLRNKVYGRWRTAPKAATPLMQHLGIGCPVKQLGTTANILPRTHDHTIPGFNLPQGPLEDDTDQGTLWDPIASAYFYSYNAASDSFTAYDGTSPTNWLQYVGRWGDQQYPDSDPRQDKIFGISQTAKYSSGPTGPRDKSLNRSEVCLPKDNTICFVSPFLRP